MMIVDSLKRPVIPAAFAGSDHCRVVPRGRASGQQVGLSVPAEL